MPGCIGVRLSPLLGNTAIPHTVLSAARPSTRRESRDLAPRVAASRRTTSLDSPRVEGHRPSTRRESRGEAPRLAANRGTTFLDTLRSPSTRGESRNDIPRLANHLWRVGVRACRHAGRWTPENTMAKDVVNDVVSQRTFARCFASSLILVL